MPPLTSCCKSRRRCLPVGYLCGCDGVSTLPWQPVPAAPSSAASKKVWTAPANERGKRRVCGRPVILIICAVQKPRRSRTLAAVDLTASSTASIGCCALDTDCFLVTETPFTTTWLDDQSSLSTSLTAVLGSSANRSIRECARAFDGWRYVGVSVYLCEQT